MEASESGSVRPSIKLSPKKKFIFIAVIVIFCVVAVEVGFRVALGLADLPVSNLRKDYYNVLKKDPREKAEIRHMDFGIYTGHPYLPFVFKSSINHLWVPQFPYPKETVNVPIITNSLGQRGREFGVKPPEGTYRILCLGGSTTFGTVEEKDSWPRTLERMLRTHYKTDKIEVLNAGTPSFTTAESLVAFAIRWLELEPNAVIVHHMINDLALSASPFYSDYSHIRKDIPTEPNLFDYAPSFFEWSSIFCFIRWKLHPDRRNDLSQLLYNRVKRKKNQMAGIDTYIRNIRTIADIARDRDIAVMLTTMSFYIPGANKPVESETKRLDPKRQWNQAVRELAAAEGLPIVDHEKSIPNEKRLHYDAIHMSPQGERLVAKNFFEEILRQGWIADAK